MPIIGIALESQCTMTISAYEWKRIIYLMMDKCRINEWKYDEDDDVITVTNNDCSKLFMLLWEISTEFDIHLT